jgi:hypothetical protein
MNCPRCRAALRMVEPSPRWMRHFICEECWSVWRVELRKIKTVCEMNRAAFYFRKETVLLPGRHARFAVS